MISHDSLSFSYSNFNFSCGDFPISDSDFSISHIDYWNSIRDFELILLLSCLACHSFSATALEKGPNTSSLLRNASFGFAYQVFWSLYSIISMGRMVICDLVDRRRCPHFLLLKCFLRIRGIRTSLVLSQYFLLCYHGTGLHWHYYKFF